MSDDPTSEVSACRPLPVPSNPDGDQLSVDRHHSILLQGEAAADMKDALGKTVREGVRLARRAKAGDVFELVPPKDLAEGLRNGTLRTATAGGGDASVLVKNVKDGRIAGSSDLQRVKPGAVKVLGPAAWQAMALATQQHISLRSPESLTTSRRASTRCWTW